MDEIIIVCMQVCLCVCVYANHIILCMCTSFSAHCTDSVIIILLCVSCQASVNGRRCIMCVCVCVCVCVCARHLTSVNGKRWRRVMFIISWMIVNFTQILFVNKVHNLYIPGTTNNNAGQKQEMSSHSFKPPL